MSDFHLPDSVIEDIADLFQAFSHPTRLQILRELHEGPRNVTELHEVIGGSQSNISNHLNKLKNEDIVTVNVKGNTREYALASQEVAEICEMVCGYFEERTHRKKQIQ